MLSLDIKPFEIKVTHHFLIPVKVDGERVIEVNINEDLVRMITQVNYTIDGDNMVHRLRFESKPFDRALCTDELKNQFKNDILSQINSNPTRKGLRPILMELL